MQLLTSIVWKYFALSVTAVYVCSDVMVRATFMVRYNAKHWNQNGLMHSLTEMRLADL